MIVPADNIILIGMAGVGKSTVGVLLAKELSRGFVDTDLVIQSAEGCCLQDIIDARGLESFCRVEEKHLLGLNCRGCVIATGGSAVYSRAAMTHLRGGGIIIHLDLSLEIIERRVQNLRTRGLVIEKGQTLAGLYHQRLPLYKQWADITIACDDKTQDEIVAAIASRLAETDAAPRR